MRSRKSRFGFLALALLFESAIVRAQLPQETTQPAVPRKDSTIKATLNEPQQPAPTPAAGTVRENPKDGLKYVWIPPGTFMMGCSEGDSECFDSEKPSHQVTISKAFWMGQTPVTVAAYQRFAAATGRQMPSAPNFNVGWANLNMPVVDVSWVDSQAYCHWSGGRLPTEAEWEYAARAGSNEARYGALDEVAWYSTDSGGATHNVAEKRANAWGLYDTLGNVWEWVNDWYDGNYYQNSLSQDPTGPSSGQFRVLRGGSWDNGARYVRVSNRSSNYPAYRVNHNGVRCVGHETSSEVVLPSTASTSDSNTGALGATVPFGSTKGDLSGAVQMLTPDQGVDFSGYLSKVVSRVRQNWYAIMPLSARLGDRGRVIVDFKIMRDGTVPLPDTFLRSTSGKDPLDSAALKSIRNSSPFDALPAAFQGPYIELRFVFSYNLPLQGPSTIGKAP